MTKLMKLTEAQIATMYDHIGRVDQAKPEAVIFDIDGTLALMGERIPYDMSKVSEDMPNLPVLRMVNVIGGFGLQVLYCSGRFETARQDTQQWLKQYTSYWNAPLFMRPSGDYCNDRILKKRIYRQEIEPTWNVVAIFDDRDSVVNMWRIELKLPCFQVNYGDF